MSAASDMLACYQYYDSIINQSAVGSSDWRCFDKEKTIFIESGNEPGEPIIKHQRAAIKIH